jgi:hypothetical protein
MRTPNFGDWTAVKSDHIDTVQVAAGMSVRWLREFALVLYHAIRHGCDDGGAKDSLGRFTAYVEQQEAGATEAVYQQSLTRFDHQDLIEKLLEYERIHKKRWDKEAKEKAKSVKTLALDVKKGKGKKAGGAAKTAERLCFGCDKQARTYVGHVMI